VAYASLCSFVKGRREVGAVRIFGGEQEAAPFGQPDLKFTTTGSQFTDPRADFPDLLPRFQGELVVLGLRGGRDSAERLRR